MRKSFLSEIIEPNEIHDNVVCLRNIYINIFINP